MIHHTLAYSAGQPANSEAYSTPHAAGPKDQKTPPTNFNKNHEQLQADDGCSAFDRLARQFEKLDLRLYWLNEPSVLVSAPKLGMSVSLPDLRTAKIYLAQIGGAA